MNDYSLPPPVWVDTPALFREMLARLRDEPELAVDTESNSLYVYQEQVCLIQLSIPGHDYLVDPLALDDLSDLGPLLADPAILKVLHGAEYDLSVVHRDFGFSLANLFDTMWASRILGWPAHGLASLLEDRFGVQLDKRYQRANWGVRPLPPEQLDYARLDTHYLLPLFRLQSAELEATHRWPQARHRFTRLAQTRWEPRGFDPDGFWQLPGARDLDDPGRGVLRELYLFREQRARAENRPPFKILGNKAIVSLSQERPRGWRQMQRIRGISRRAVDKYGPDLQLAMQRGVRRPLAWSGRPRTAGHHPRVSNGHPTPKEQARYEVLRSWRNNEAEGRGVAPDIVLTNQVLRAIAQRDPRRHADLLRDGLLAPWQAEEFGADLLSLLADLR